MSEHFKRCKANVLRKARDLADAINRGRMNYDAAEWIIESYLNQPAYYPSHRDRLQKIAEDYIYEETKSSRRASR